MAVKPNKQETEAPVTDLKFDDLLDVQVSDAQNGEFVSWNDSLLQWEPSTVAGSTYDSLFPVVDVTGNGVGLDVNHSYIMNNNTTRVIATLPSSANVGQVIELIGRGSQGWSLEVGASQTIRIGDQSCNESTGKIQSGSRYDCITIKCIYANLEWVAVSAIGNLEVS